MKLKVLLILLACASLTACNILSPTEQPLPTVVLGSGAASTPSTPVIEAGDSWSFRSASGPLL